MINCLKRIVLSVYALKGWEKEAKAVIKRFDGFFRGALLRFSH